MKKRPPSARRSIQQQSFSPYLSSKRLRSVQSLFSSDQTNSDEDAIVAILGIDSRYNEGCRELANFLFFNFYDLRLPDLEESGIPEEDLDDVIILIRPSSVSLYCSSVLYNYLLPYVAHWQNLDIFCMGIETEGEVDEDEQEEFKIRSFVQMIKGCKSLGVPYYASRSVHSKLNLDDGLFDKFQVEKWPLIQSYALEGIGGGGFFTMCHEVSNIRSKLLPLYEECDPASLEQMLIKSLPLFERHWREAMNVITGSSGDAETRLYQALPDVTESQVLEPIRSYFRHGRLSEHSFSPTANGDGNTETHPFVQFGVHTADQRDCMGSKLATIGNSGSNGSAMHMIIHSAAPRSPIACTRTYFINPRNMSAASKREFSKLVSMYSACVEACKVAIDVFCTSLNVNQAKKAVEAIMNKAIVNLSHKAAYEFSLQAVDNCGRPLPMTDDVVSCYVKRVTVSVQNIQSTENGNLLGNVMFSDTFIESTITSVQTECDSNATQSIAPRHSCNLVLSAGVPAYSNWMLDEMDANNNNNKLCTLENLFMTSPVPLAYLLKNNNVGWFDDGSLTINLLHGTPISIKSDYVHKFSWFESSQSHTVAVLGIELKPGCVNNLPSCLLENSSIALMFYPQTTAIKSFNSKVKPVLELVANDTSKFTFTTVDVPEPSFNKQLSLAQSIYEWHTRSSMTTNSESWLAKINKCALSLQPHLSYFFQHFGISSVLNGVVVPDCDMGMLLNDLNENGEAQPSKTANDSKVCISVVAGLPGSHVDHLCSSLVSLHKERVRWVTVRVKCNDRDASSMDVQHFQKTLTDVVSKRKAMRPGAAATKRLRVIVEVMGFIDIGPVIESIVNHPNPATKNNMHVGAVTTCVEPLSCLLEHKRFLPKMAEQCRAGLVNCIAFTGSSEDLKDKNLADMKTFIRSVNPEAAFLLAADGHTSRSGDFDLILSESAFNTADCIKTRHLSVPGLWNGSFDFGRPQLALKKVNLDFSQPLLRGTFSARLRTLRHALAPPPYAENVYAVNGIVSFTDSPGCDNDVTFVTCTGQLTVDQKSAPTQIKAPAPPPSKNNQVSRPYNLSFYGVDLCEKTLKDWLRKCGRQKPTKKCHKTRTTLSKAEIKAIQDAHSTDPLPEGIFFNGTQYCSLLDNSRSYHHPHLNKFIDVYLSEENAKIDAFNHKIEKESLADMFD
uniref:Uncharacterized protein C20orf194 homolog n=1 Tax=Phallusia mammillata TaxID=59560 RepID=A0A6F9D7H4_9ASCI|nr:uncharacterized protein C20orf194 homolog [Phallusia mammillata]